MTVVSVGARLAAKDPARNDPLNAQDAVKPILLGSPAKPIEIDLDLKDKSSGTSETSKSQGHPVVIKVEPDVDLDLKDKSSGTTETSKSQGHPVVIKEEPEDADVDKKRKKNSSTRTSPKKAKIEEDE